MAINLNLTKPLVFLDLETTGLNICNDRIIEISLLKINVDNSKDNKTYLINPQIPISYEVSLIHGITNDDVKDMPIFAEVADAIIQFIGGSDLAGYNSNRFDIPILIEEFMRNSIDFDLDNRCLIDVQNIFHKMEKRTLKAAYKFYCNEDLVNAHSAEADTLATYKVLMSQIEKYSDTEYVDNYGNISKPIANDVKALHKFSTANNSADLANYIIFNQNNKEVFNFGKHKGKIVEDLFLKEPSYYKWIMRSEFPLLTKKIITSIKLRSDNNKVKV